MPFISLICEFVIILPFLLPITLLLLYLNYFTLFGTHLPIALLVSGDASGRFGILYAIFDCGGVILFCVCFALILGSWLGVNVSIAATKTAIAEPGSEIVRGMIVSLSTIGGVCYARPAMVGDVGYVVFSDLGGVLECQWQYNAIYLGLFLCGNYSMGDLLWVYYGHLTNRDLDSRDMAFGELVGVDSCGRPLTYRARWPF